MRITHQWSDTRATVRIEGLPTKTRVLHITDSHVALADERNSDWREAAALTREKFVKHHFEATGRNAHTEKTFCDTLSAFKGQEIDLIALTGDIVHLPSKASVEHISGALKSCGVPWLYTSGNHDWNFGGQPCTDETRAKFWPELQPLHCGPAAASSRVVSGVNFLAVDNSNYQISEEQLAFVKAELARGLPSVLLIHIPLSLPTLRAPTVARWKSPILMADPEWAPEDRERWGTRLDDKETLECMRLLSASANLAAVLCGHIHFPHADNVSARAVQYVGKPGYEGGTRVVEFLPL
ncbi:MAG TPA: metallophosphoesterase [Planctomycetota bacterium]|nr:metallophosphoesterase [Planctomycetota bacterium]